MIKGIGVDIVEINEIKKSIERSNSFIKYAYTVNEINNERGNKYEYYASRFACKEAVFKALAPLTDIKFEFRKIEILNNEDGSPYVVINEEISKILKSCDVDNLKISLSHSTNNAIAFCVASKD